MWTFSLRTAHPRALRRRWLLTESSCVSGLRKQARMSGAPARKGRPVGASRDPEMRLHRSCLGSRGE